MKKRVLAWLLVLIMIAGILVMPAAAEDSTGDGTVAGQNEGGDGDDTGGSDGNTGDGTGGSENNTGDGTGGSEGNTGDGTGGSEDNTGDGAGGSENNTGNGTDGSENDTGDGTGGSEDNTGDGTGGSEDNTGDGTGGSEDNTDDGTDGSGDTSCKHSWLYVEVDATCTEYGAKGYYCTLCEAVTGAEAIDLVPHTYDNSCDASCNVCSETREIEHKFSTQWSKNSTKHWHACTVCGAKNGEGDHYPGPAATEEKAQYCLTCGLMMMPQKSHTHTYSQEYTSDETGHWYACGGCDEKKDFQMHTYDNLCDPDCNDCGFTTQTAHSFNGNWQSDETGHWEVCMLCQETGASQVHTPGPEATDLAPQLCSVCNYELAPALTHTHTPGEIWQSDAQKHWKTCICGEKVEAADHAWDSGTGQENDSVTFVCMDCGAEKTEEAPEESSGGFPWWILLVVLVVVMIGALIALIVVLFGGRKKGKYHR